MENRTIKSVSLETAEMARHIKKQTTLLRICAVACVGILLTVLITVFTVMPKLNTTLSNLAQASEQISRVDWEELTGNINELATTGQSAMLQAAEKVEEIDIASLNEAIAELKRLIEPLANLFG